MQAHAWDWYQTKLRIEALRGDIYALDARNYRLLLVNRDQGEHNVERELKFELCVKCRFWVYGKCFSIVSRRQLPIPNRLRTRSDSKAGILVEWNHER